MSEPTIKKSSIAEIWSLTKPNGRFNEWGERKWIAVSPEKQDMIDKEITGLNLSPRAKEFLLLFVSIESLATYIESSKTSKDSILKQVLGVMWLTHPIG
jgi:hypothetical protein